MPSLASFRAYAHLDDPEDPTAEECYLYAVRSALDSGIPAWRFFANSGAGDAKLNAYINMVAGAEYDNRNGEFVSDKLTDAFIRIQGQRRRELMYPTAPPEGTVQRIYDLNRIPDEQSFTEPEGGDADA